MADLLQCAFCNNTDVHIRFTNKSLEKCRNILRHRKEHNLKYKDVFLPRDLTYGGYHRQCYKSFTALMKKYYLPKSIKTERDPLSMQENYIKNENDDDFEIDILHGNNPSTSLATESNIKSEPTTASECVEPDRLLQKNEVKQENIPSSSSEIYIQTDSDVSIAKNIDTCLFCDQNKKKHRSKILPLFSTDKTNFFSKMYQEDEVYAGIIDKTLNYPGFKVYYHEFCLQKFLYEASRSKKKPIKRSWHNIRERNQAAFGDLCAFIQENVVENGRCFLLSYLQKYYIDLIEEKDEDNEEVRGNFKPHNLESKIMKAFNKEIKFLVVRNKKILAPKHMTSIDEGSYEKMKDEDLLRQAALLLRKSVLNIDKEKYPQNISIENVMGGSVSVPHELTDFYSTLIAGSSGKKKENPKLVRQVKIYCEDVVYVVHNS